jgi:hypothetical protein
LLEKEGLWIEITGSEIDGRGGTKDENETEIS